MNRFFLTVLLGYLVGILFAPKKGKDLREDIRERLKDLQNKGTDVAKLLLQKGQALRDSATPAAAQVQIEGKMLQQESEEIARNATKFLNESCERGATALEQAERRIKEKAAPAISLVKEDANELKNQGALFLKKASTAFTNTTQIGSKADAANAGAGEAILKEASNI